jgi:hypothetical protein
MDDNLSHLESTAASRAVMYVRFAVIGVGILAVAGAGFLIYRRTRKPSLRDRLDEVSIDNLRALLDRLKDEMPSVTLRLNEKAEHEPGMIESIIRNVAPSIVGTASTALLQRVVSAPALGKRDGATQVE